MCICVALEFIIIICCSGALGFRLAELKKCALFVIIRLKKYRALFISPRDDDTLCLFIVVERISLKCLPNES